MDNRPIPRLEFSPNSRRGEMPSREGAFSYVGLRGNVLEFTPASRQHPASQDMRILATVPMLALAASCATDGGFKSTELRWEKLHNQPGFDAYVTTFINAQNAAHLDSNSGCYEYDVGTTVDLLLVVESSGKISAAYTDTETKKARCFRKAYAGVKAPIPPFSPFPLRMRVR
jgi:hypothetical protein